MKSEKDVHGDQGEGTDGAHNLQRDKRDKKLRIVVPVSMCNV